MVELRFLEEEISHHQRRQLAADLLQPAIDYPKGRVLGCGFLSKTSVELIEEFLHELSSLGVLEWLEFSNQMLLKQVSSTSNMLMSIVDSPN